MDKTKTSTIADPHAKKRGAQPGNTNAMKHGFRANEPQASIAHPGGIGHQDYSAEEHPRKRGGQPGNTNAMTHGFYSEIFKTQERRLLAEIPLDDLSAEIELLRVTNRRFLDALTASKDQLDFETQLTALRAVNLSAHSIATLLRAHALGALARQELALYSFDLPGDPPNQDHHDHDAP